MAKDQFIVGLDVGSSKIVATVGTITEGQLNIVAAVAVPHSGLRKGVIVDMEETISMISHALEQAEKMAGGQISHAFLSVGGNHIEATPAKGVVAVSKPSGEIDHEDVIRVIDAAKTVALPQNREQIHVFPHHFTVDGTEEIRDPIGMTGVRLEVDALIVSGSSSAVRNLARAAEQAGLEVDGIVFAPLAAAKTLTNKKQREGGVVVADIGSGSTGIAVFEEGELIHTANIPIGSMHITNDIAIGLRTNLDVAEMLKVRYGTCLPGKIREGEVINLNTLDPAEDEKVSRKQVAEIIEARIAEICQQIKDQLRLIDKDGLLPAGIVLTGGGSELEGLTEIARHQLRLPAQVGFPQATFSGIVDKLDSPVYATSIGLVLWGMEEHGTTNAPWRPSFGQLGGVFDRLKSLFRNFTN